MLGSNAIKSSSKIVASVGCLILICGAAITWHLLKAKANERNLAEDARACRLRAEEGDADAEYRLALLYQHGKGVPQDYTEAVRWYRKAAEQGYTRAQYDLGYMYYRGKEVPQDYAEAASWWRKAAEQGSAKAQEGIGFLYHHGWGVGHDDTEAVRWYRKAAEQGYARAQYDLGYMYYWGKGVPQDRAEANRLFHEAARQGDEDAQRFLGFRARRLTTWNKIFLSIAFLGSFSLLIGSLGRKQSVRNRRITALTGLLGLSYGGLDLYRYLHIGLLQSSSATIAFYFAIHLLRGVLLAMLLSIVFPKGARVVLGISGILFIAFNLFAIAHYGLGHLAPAIRVLSLVNGLSIGMSIPSAIFLWLDGKEKRGSRNGNGGVAVPGN